MKDISTRAGEFIESDNEREEYKEGANENDYGSIRYYLKDIKDIPLLTSEEEIELGKRISEGDEYARKRMIEGNLRLVFKIAKNYQGNGLSLGDLINEGNIGLIKAVEKFDYTKNYKFSTYGAWWIKSKIMKALTNQGRMIRLPAYQVNRLIHIKKLEKIGYSGEEILSLLKISLEEIMYLQRTKTDSLDSPIFEEKQSDTIRDYVTDFNDSPETLTLKNIAVEEVNNLMNNTLKEREIGIIKMRYGLGGIEEKTLEETRKVYGITKERVRQIEKAALDKMREKAKNTLKNYNN